MSSPSLKQLYQDHQGKVSDKWTSYIEKYEELFGPYRDEDVSLLEIGVQNGGSLEIYAKYFQQAKALVGCDIDELCGTLEYEDNRINIVVGDVNSEESEQKILDISPTFDIIIDDGSHHSKDIVSSFSRYFKHLKFDGTYIIEDLYCSYWEHYGGGLLKTTSSNSFFKLLVDIINHEHWGIDGLRLDLLASFSEQYSIDFDEGVLSQIHAVTFTNSMCFIKKKKQALNELRAQFVAGRKEQVWEGRKVLHGKSNIVLSQKDNFWAEAMPMEKMVDVQNQRVTCLKADLKEKNAETLRLETALREKNAETLRLETTLKEKNTQVAELEQRLSTLAIERDNLSADITVMLRSNSWKLTAPLRFIFHKFFDRSSN